MRRQPTLRRRHSSSSTMWSALAPRLIAFFFFQAEDGIRDHCVTGVQTCALPIFGLGARDTLRLEKGYLLSGQDFDGHQTPLEVNSAWLVKWARPFLGREALERQRARDDYRRLVGIRMDERGIPRHGHPVRSRGKEAGQVTSGTMSPSLRVGIALASVDKSASAVGTPLDVDIRGTAHPAHVVKLPFL